MRSLVFLLAGLFASAGLIHGEIKTPESGPIEITSTGQTTYENGLATARDNVVIHIGNTDIYADYAQYNPTTHGHEEAGIDCQCRPPHSDQAAKRAACKCKRATVVCSNLASAISGRAVATTLRR